MATIKKFLTERDFKSIKEPCVYKDLFGGLRLQLDVTRLSSGQLRKRFRQRVTLKGNDVYVSIGLYPVVSLKEAHDKALENVRLAFNGTDPRRPDKKEQKAPIFDDATEKVIAQRRKSWTNSGTEVNWRNRLKKHASPKIGKKRVDDITEDDVINVLQPLLDSNKLPTAKGLLRYIRQIMEWYEDESKDDNFVTPVTERIRRIVRRQKGHKTKPIRSVPYERVSEALHAIRGDTGKPHTKLAQETQVLSAMRHMSIRKAHWDEIDWDNKIWNSPAEHMKMGLPHRVPLSTGMMKALEKARLLKREDSDLIFPGNRGAVMGDATLSVMCRRLNLPGTPHGFRSSFATWCADKGVPQEVAEAALAHTPDAIVKAYTRTDYLERRRSLMQAWSDNLEGKLDDTWRFEESDAQLVNLLTETQRLLTEAHDELAKLRAELEALKAE